MKYILILLCIAAIQFNATAQKIAETAVPLAVKESVNKMYANPKVDKWEIEDGNYEASFIAKGTVKAVSSSALFTADGKFLQFEYAITANEVPEAAKNYVATNFPGKTMSEMTKIKTVTGAVTYEIEVDEKDYIFDSNGNYLKMEEKDNIEEK